MKDFLLTVTTPEGKAFSSRVFSLTARGRMGQITILQGHAPLMSVVLGGRCRMTLRDGQEREAMTSEGVLSVREDEVTLLCQSFDYINRDNRDITF